ncbi:ATP-binding protein [Streptosporangium lutulentum]|uniref:Anti-sigma regulatory factor (Ser/Thr protein kinase) n=1 Tax=Streptosporangium lutulentum TaxID=1461250 RepID=A0ABT9QRI8_9ACTN|nr:ATP-binding protein [Streptosporangium lutulentum]MDP9848644.1 anti-sigma regulatory factor (Ser/Thr protein kinase) [Streptosporangium lutulentum]
MAARLLSLLVGAFTDRFRPMTTDTTGPAHPDRMWPPRLGQTPMISQRFTAIPSQVRPARTFVAELLGDDHPCRDDAMLLTSELATNAIEHPTGPADRPQEFLITVTFVLNGVLITVQDPGSSQIPCPKTTGPYATGGRGLTLVNDLATRWGFHRDSIGTVVWFELTSPDG